MMRLVLLLAALALSACVAPLTQEPALRGADVAFFGEVHDNPAHHRLQAEAVAAMGADALVFEMIPRDLEGAANAARGDIAALEAALDWEARGWPDFAIYAPIFKAAPEARIYGAEADRDALRLAMHQGLPEAGQEMRLDHAALGLARGWPAAEDALLAGEIEAAHCGLLNADTAQRMVAAQRLRDAALADAVLRAREDGAARVAVIAGNAHARRAPGAPQWLARAAPDLDIVSIGFTEGGGTEGFDLTRRTEAAERSDPCAALLSRSGG